MKFDFISLDYLGDALLSKRWIFAKTMPRNPHWYTLRKEWLNDDLFDGVVKVMRRIGYTEYYQGRPYTMVNINGFKYWTMGAPIKDTILINRKEIHPPADYDMVAEHYDELHADEESIKENKAVVSMLDCGDDLILDVGCGTGLLLDYAAPTRYIGIDPSLKMLTVAKRKHPDARFIQTGLEEYAGRVDYVVSLFGAASHIHPEAISRIPTLAKRWFVMFYKDGYYPVTFSRAGVDIPFYTGNHMLLGGEITEFGNFYIVRGGR